MNPKVSVIIPVYNIEKYLERCLRSVCDQTFKDIEIICINDGSKDNCLNILKSFKPGISTSNAIVIFDTIVVTLNVICFKELEIGLYSAISIYLMGKVIDIIFEGIGFSKMVLIVFKEYKKISKLNFENCFF